MPIKINVIAKCVPAIMILCGFILAFYYGGAYADKPNMVENGGWMVFGGFVLQIVWLYARYIHKK